MNQLSKASWAQVHFNADFVCIETASGYRSDRIDPKGARHLLSPEVSDEDFGVALLDAMARSRFVLGEPREGIWIHPDTEFDMDFYDPKKTEARYEDWQRSLMNRYGYKSKKALFKGMKNCLVERRDALIKLTPMHHESLEGWGRTKGDGIENVEIAADSTPAEVGAALRLALGRCTE